MRKIRARTKQIAVRPLHAQFATALELVTALTNEQHLALNNFAANRMRRMSVTPDLQRCLGIKSPVELVHDAIKKVLLGDQEPHRGCRLSLEQRKDPEAFFRRLCTIINSDLANLVTSAEANHQHFPVDDEHTETPSVALADRTDLDGLLQRRDLKRLLFAQLRDATRAKPALAAVVAHWEANFEYSDYIARGDFDRRLVFQVRQLAQVILRQYAQEIEPSSDHGLEMLF